MLLQLAATAILERDQQHLLVGDKLFFDLVITASQAKNDMKYYDYQHKEVLERLLVAFVCMKINTCTIQHITVTHTQLYSPKHGRYKI